MVLGANISIHLIVAFVIPSPTAPIVVAFTIIESLPYHRAKYIDEELPARVPTAEREYHEPCDRRLHAQPNARPWCGPTANHGILPAKSLIEEEVLRQVVELREEEKLLCSKALGGFEPTVDAETKGVCRTCASGANREEKPVAVMALLLRRQRMTFVAAPSWKTVTAFAGIVHRPPRGTDASRRPSSVRKFETLAVPRCETLLWGSSAAPVVRRSSRCNERA